MRVETVSMPIVASSPAESSANLRVLKDCKIEIEKVGRSPATVESRCLL